MTRQRRRRGRIRLPLRIFRDGSVRCGAVAARSENRQRRADVIKARGEHRHRVVSGILRSAFGVWRSDAVAVRGRAGGRAAGILRPHHLSREDCRASTHCSSRRRSDAIASNLTRSRQIKSGNRYRSSRRCRSSQKPASSQSFTDLEIPNESQFRPLVLDRAYHFQSSPMNRHSRSPSACRKGCQNLIHALQRIAH
jgi:hypothetical protein